MFTHCLSCRTPFAEPAAVDVAVPGDRVAYEPGHGRLWSICRICRSWTLAPIEERWEVVEALERRTRSTGGGADASRLLARTDNVGLFVSGPLRVVRVGETSRLEEAWWRYGEELRSRWEYGRRLGVRGAVTVGAAIVGGVLGATLPARYAFRDAATVRRWLRFGERAWTGRRTCASCRHVFTELTFFDRRILTLDPDEDGERAPSLLRRCPRCRDAGLGGLRLEGSEADQTLRRILAYQNFSGAGEPGVAAAVKLIEGAGRPSELVRLLARYGGRLGDFPHTALVALEIAANEAVERRLLQLEVRALERWWREAAELASIVDGELTPVSGVDRLRRRAAEEL